VDAVDNNQTASLNLTQSSTRSANGMSLLAASNDRYDLIIAMSGTSTDLVAAQAAGNASASNATKAVAFGNSFLPGTQLFVIAALPPPHHHRNTTGMRYPAVPYDAFTALVAGGLNMTWSNPMKPVNVLCTGKGAASTMVPLCGVWAALAFPQAHILVEAFNATWPMANGQFNWTLSQIVEQTYVWQDDTDAIGKGKVRRHGHYCT
jgi:hypothetical protein